MSASNVIRGCIRPGGLWLKVLAGGKDGGSDKPPTPPPVASKLRRIA